MLEHNLKQLFEEMKLGSAPQLEKDGSVKIEIGNISLRLQKLTPGVHFSALIFPPPKKKQEEFFLTLMQANFMGQGTGGAALGLTEDESFVTLVLTAAEEVSYFPFKEIVEEFINYVEYWKTKTSQYDSEAQVK